MNVSNERAEETVVGVLRAARANDIETAPAHHSGQTDRCPNVARFAAYYKFGVAWTADEAAHVRGCPFCQKVSAMFTAVIGETAREDTVTNRGGTEDTRTEPNPPAPEARPESS
jgi:hypothetical protein